MKVRLSIVSYDLPMEEPVRTSAATHVRRAGFWVLARDWEKRAGLGETAPLSVLATESLEEAREEIARHPAVDLAVVSALEVFSPSCPATRAGVNLALLDLRAQRAGVRVADLLGSSVTERVACHALLRGEEPEALAREAAAAVEAGFRGVKIKLAGRPLAEDIERVRAVREAAGPQTLLRGDANAGWEVEEAREALRLLEPFGFDFIEEPAAGGLERLRGKSGIALAADESAGSPPAARELIRSGAAKVLVIKPMAFGGPSPAVALAREALAAGMRVVVTSILDTPVGIAGALSVAAALPPGDLHGLATASLLGGAPVEGLPETAGGELRLPAGPGLGVRLLAEALAAERR
jgi:o-succinylbenzoate synthase